MTASLPTTPPMEERPALTVNPQCSHTIVLFIHDRKTSHNLKHFKITSFRPALEGPAQV